MISNNVVIYNKDNQKIVCSFSISNSHRVSFFYKEDKLLCKYPKSASIKKIISYIQENFDYFYKGYLKNLKRFEKYRFYYDNNKIYIYNILYDIIFTDLNTKYLIDENKKIVYISNKYINDIIKIKHIILKDMLTNFLKENELFIHNRISKHFISLRKYSIKYMKSIYGSYSIKTNTISLNLLLAQFERNEILSVIFHEYSHCIKRNHSKEFYDVLLSIYPEYKIYDKSMRQKPIV